MPVRRYLALAVPAVVLGVVAPALAQPADTGQERTAQERPVIDAAVQVSTDPTPVRAYAEPVVAVHPADPDVIAVGSGEARTSRCALHVSANAGLSWRALPGPAVEGLPRCVWSNNGGIVDLTFGPDGTLYYAFSAGAVSDWHRRIFLARSGDLGRTFDIAEIPGLEPDPDAGHLGVHALPAVAVDPSDPQRVVLAWWSNYGTWNLGGVLPEGRLFPGRPLVSVSDDGGRTFAPPVEAIGNLEVSANGVDMVIADDGTMMVFFGEITFPADGPVASGAHLNLAVSRDGGASFEARHIHQMPDSEDHSILTAPRAAVDRDGGTYVVWEEMGGGPAAVLLMRSPDAGRSWDDPVRINDTEPQRTWLWNELWPSVAVAPGGRVDVAWYDWRTDPQASPDGNAYQDVFTSFSTDGGRSWSPDLRVSDRSIDRRISIYELGMGAPVGLAAREGMTYFAWDDTRNGDDRTRTQDIYFTRGRYGQMADVGLAGSVPGPSSLLWVGVGVGGALLVAGLVLAVGARMARRRAHTTGGVSR